ncbi:type II toxin-antitoxin system RelE/ParE family toxin [Prosthecobacter sp.]|uniref:type II toxin-antitoxin system RelE/ParE family toxin n=1 Tax=Prosthecobacter sp. TaxID=1965333 RepID=UPI003782FE78
MKSQPVEFLEPVEHDLRYAREFYESWKLHGARDFMQRFRESVAWVEWNPEMFPRKHRQFRRAIIRRSYFGIYYVIEPKVTTVAAVLDMRRDPRSIRELLESRN